MDLNKKVSFGFNKLIKKPAVIQIQPPEEKKVELVECLEGQSIKIKGALEVIKQPLIIPIKDNKKNLLDRVKEAKAKHREPIKHEEDTRPDSELTIEELAARALINDAKNRLENNAVSNSKISIVPIKDDKILIDGEEESTLEDYENVPITDYGMAMLRGMGWKEGMGIGKDSTKIAVANAPELRPKGLGLGATRTVKSEAPACDKEGNALILKKGAYAKIIAGSHKGNYCEVQGLDDEAGRVIVKTSLKGEILTLNEFLLVPVTKDEYSRSAKVLNNEKYEEYKEISDKKLETYKKSQSKVSYKYSDNESEGELNSKPRYIKKEKDKLNAYKREQSSESYSSNDDGNIKHKAENERKSRESSKTRSQRNQDKYEKNRKSKHRDASSSDSNREHEKSKNRHRYSSDSDSSSGRDSRSRKKRSKAKKNKKDRHKGRSRSRKDRRKTDRISESKYRNRTSSRDRTEKNSDQKHKSKSRHRRSSNNSSDQHRRR